MSIARDMRMCTLQEKVLERGKSGAKNPTWKNVAEINAAIYKNSELIVSASERYKDSTHAGLTYYKGIMAGKHRLLKDGVVYQVISCDSNHRLANLLLKVVETDV